MSTRSDSWLQALLGVTVSLAIGCASVPQPADTVYTPIPGTRVAVQVPPDYSINDQFAGFSNAQGASLLVTEWSGSEQTLNDEIDLPEFAERGMSVVSDERVPIDGAPRRLVGVTQQRASGVTLERRILIVGDTATTSVVTVTAVQQPFPPELDQALRSVRRDAGRQIAPFEGLGFELDESGTLAISARVAEVVYMTPRHLPLPAGPRDPQLIAGRANTPSGAELADFAADRLALTPGLQHIEVISDRSFEIGGLPALELIARAEDLDSREPISVLQVIAVDQRRYFLVQGRVGSSDADQFLPEFRRIAASFRRTD